MPKQERVTRTTTKTRREDAAAEAKEADHSKAQAIKDEMDELMEDIDSVLEENAQEFVEQYIQKGGE